MTIKVGDILIRKEPGINLYKVTWLTDKRDVFIARQFYPYHTGEHRCVIDYYNHFDKPIAKLIN